MGLRHHNCSPSCFGLTAAALLRQRHPFHTAKLVARDLGVTVKTAENILAGHLSARTITKLIEAYGLGFVIEAGAEITGQTLRDFIVSQAEQARLEQAKAQEREHELRRLEAELREVRSFAPSSRRPVP